MTVTTEISRVHTENYGVYGIRKIHAQLARENIAPAGRPVARCTVGRLMKAVGLRGISRAKGPRTTVPGKGPDTRPDLVKRAFTATGQDQLWVADITYVRTFAGWVYAAFVLDVFSRRILGWQLSTSLRTDLALDALDMGLWTRTRDGHQTTALVHHSDRGVQYLAVRYTERLAEAGAVASVGSKGDSYDNAMAEALNGTFKSELVKLHGPWRTRAQLEIAIIASRKLSENIILHQSISPAAASNIRLAPPPLRQFPETAYIKRESNENALSRIIRSDFAPAWRGLKT